MGGTVLSTIWKKSLRVN